MADFLTGLAMTLGYVGLLAGLALLVYTGDRS